MCKTRTIVVRTEATKLIAPIKINKWAIFKVNTMHSSRNSGRMMTPKPITKWRVIMPIVLPLIQPFPV